MKHARRTSALLPLLLILIAGLVFLAACPDSDDDDDDDNDDNGDDDDSQDTSPPEFDGLQSAETDEDGNIILQWYKASDPSFPVTYNVYMASVSGEQDFGNPSGQTQELTYTVPGLEICEEYFFVVRAMDALGQEEQNAAEKSAVPVNYHCDYSQADRVVWTFSAPGGPFNIETLSWINDVDGDGLADVLVESYDSRANEYNPGDHVFCLNGATGEVIWSQRPANELGYGSGGWGDKCLNRSPDLNGDGFDDVLFGSAWGDRAAYALDGVDGAVLWYFDSYSNPASPGSGWIYEIQPTPDITGDGVPEAAFCLTSDNDQAYLVDGATGDVLWQMTNSNDSVESIAVINDANNDQIPDVAFGGGDSEENRVFCVSGASTGNGTLLWTHDSLSSNFAMTSIGDVNGDGIMEVVTGAWPGYQTPSRVIALSGKDGTSLWVYTDTDFTHPTRIVNLGDVDFDGYDDVAVASWADFIVAISGESGTEIWKNSTGVENDLVWAVDAVQDITGDGITDVIAGSFSSLVFAIDGASGETLWTYDTGDSKLFSVRGIPDVTGDCVPDMVGGTQALSSEDAGLGTVFLFEGCP